MPIYTHSTRWMRFITVVLVVSVSACGGGVKSTVVSPSVVSPPVVSIAAPASTTVSSSASTLVWTVQEITERRPVPNLRLRVRQGTRLDGAVGGADLPDITTDVSGRFETPNTRQILFVTTAPGSDYRFPCDFFPVDIPGAIAVLPVVRSSWLGDRLPAGMWIPGTSIYGIVSERINGETYPVAGATVTLDAGTQDPPALTTATGFYMICSVVGTDQTRTVTVAKEGYNPATRKILGGWDYSIDLELARK